MESFLIFASILLVLSGSSCSGDLPNLANETHSNGGEEYDGDVSMKVKTHDPSCNILEKKIPPNVPNFSVCSKNYSNNYDEYSTYTITSPIGTKMILMCQDFEVPCGYDEMIISPSGDPTFADALPTICSQPGAPICAYAQSVTNRMNIGLRSVSGIAKPEPILEVLARRFHCDIMVKKSRELPSVPSTQQQQLIVTTPTPVPFQTLPPTSIEVPPTNLHDLPDYTTPKPGITTESRIIPILTTEAPNFIIPQSVPISLSLFPPTVTLPQYALPIPNSTTSPPPTLMSSTIITTQLPMAMNTPTDSSGEKIVGFALSTTMFQLCIFYTIVVILVKIYKKLGFD